MCHRQPMRSRRKFRLAVRNKSAGSIPLKREIRIERNYSKITRVDLHIDDVYGRITFYILLLTPK